MLIDLLKRTIDQSLKLTDIAWKVVSLKTLNHRLGDFWSFMPSEFSTAQSYAIPKPLPEILSTYSERWYPNQAAAPNNVGADRL